MLIARLLIFITLLKTEGETMSHIKDPYKMECHKMGLRCHRNAVCRLDEVTASFYCQCLPGYAGDGYNSCEEPDFRVTAANLSYCDGLGEQVCLLKRMPGQNAVFRVSVEGSYEQEQIKWYKLYVSEGPRFHSYRRRLSPAAELPPQMAVLNHSLALMIYSIDEDDFYPNKFWVEVVPYDLPDKSVNLEPYDLTGFGMLNPSQLRYYFILERMPIDIGEFLEGDHVVLGLPRYLNVSPSSFVQWYKEPDDLTLLGTKSLPFANDSAGVEIKGVMEEDFGYIRAVVYDFTSEIPGKVMVAQRLFNLRKDISKVCSGERSLLNCDCKPGFVGNGVHCIDLNECKEGMPLTCLLEAMCINTYGSYVCQCPNGYEGDGLYSCIDIDECVRKSYSCSPNATCVNTLGSHTCMCNSGYIGDGNQCVARSIWTPWSPWSICTVTCGYQNRMRIRRCTHPESGMRCRGPSTDLQPCPMGDACPVDGQWSDWSPWSPCSSPCFGKKRRLRLCDNPRPANGGRHCAGRSEETAECDVGKCPVDGGWSQWSSWSPCPISCGLGVVSRYRRCNNPAPQHGGKKCAGFKYEEGSCGFPEAYCKYLRKTSESVLL